MSVTHKVQRTANAPKTPPDELETSVAQALIDLENNVPELKAELRPLQISAAREVDVRGGKKTIVIFVPVPQLKAFRKVQQRHVVSPVCEGCRTHTLGQTDPGARKEILGSPRRVRGAAPNASQADTNLASETKEAPQPDSDQCPRTDSGRPRVPDRDRRQTDPSRDWRVETAESVRFPGSVWIVGVELTRFGYRFLDAKDATSLEYKLDSFTSVYRRLTGKDVVFEFPVTAQE
jgi:small subunit ribosomal protein S7e